MTIATRLNGPLLLVEAIGVLTHDDLPSLIKAFEAAHRAGPFVVITDTLQMTSAPTDVISAFASGIKQVAPGSKNWLGDAVVVKSVAVRFVLSTLLMIAPMPAEVKVFDSMADARRWCGVLLRKHGLPSPLLRSA
ncbi:Hypothetical protein A7982_00989 [Minicystis rosea]|nr:Hypothetical protein A7982_00989 [Minicystis rosea]